MSTDPEIDAEVLKVMGKLGAAHEPVSHNDIWPDLPEGIEGKMRKQVGGFGSETGLAYLNEMAFDRTIKKFDGGKFGF